MSQSIYIHFDLGAAAKTEMKTQAACKTVTVPQMTDVQCP